MSGNAWIVAACGEGDELDLEQLCRACAVSAQWVDARVRAGLLQPLPAASEPSTQWRFDSAMLVRVRLMRRIERDFDAVPELAALVADLQDEIRRLRLRLGDRG